MYPHVRIIMLFKYFDAWFELVAGAEPGFQTYGFGFLILLSYWGFN